MNDLQSMLERAKKAVETVQACGLAPPMRSAAQRRADMPLLPKAPQRPRHELGDLPLFGDTHKQLDLIDAIRRNKP
jgi:hypothetical protein